MRRALVMLLACTACGRPRSGSSPYSPLPVDPDAIRRACAMEVSCFATPPITPGGSCVSQFELGLATGIGIIFGPSATDIARYVKCSGSSPSCADALNCASGNHGPAWCGAHSSPTCDGDTLVGCIGGWGLELNDCTATGQHCRTANGFSSCSDGSACDPSVPAHCTGNRFVECDAGSKLESSIECGALYAGGRCISVTMGGSSTTGCFPAASASCGADGATCDGTTAVICAFGAQYRVACGQFASHCVVDNMGKFDCVPDASGCTASSPDTCSGSALVVCVNGGYASTPCTDIGLSTCQSAGGAARCQ
jgi:hypothetical protein